MSEKDTCKACGAQLPQNAQFRIQCGTGVSETEAGDIISRGTTAPSPITIDGVLVVSSNWIPGYKIVETRGFIYGLTAVSYTHLRAHETPEHLVCRLLH